MLVECFSANAQVKGLLQVRAVQADSQLSWQEGGIGLYRHDAANQGVVLSQGIIDLSADISSSWSAHAVVNLYQDPKSTLGLVRLICNINL